MTFDKYLKRHPLADNAFGILVFIMNFTLWLGYSGLGLWLMMMMITCQIACYIMATYVCYLLCEVTGWIISPFMFVLWGHATHWWVTEQYPQYLKDLWKTYYDHVLSLKF